MCRCGGSVTVLPAPAGCTIRYQAPDRAVRTAVVIGFRVCTGCRDGCALFLDFYGDVTCGSGATVHCLGEDERATASRLRAV
ncbi:hypothetical protein CK936_30265 [Streptomyces albireticuli]|uniref:Uncharacterized protein n=1 Tax=Streptomyces albireticuli TaxID=1940 RepID=A0A2A2D1T4_9ACTN|nr:hypothetical protein CK936_30265 [Streptomyces albireticuli]